MLCSLAVSTSSRQTFVALSSSVQCPSWPHRVCSYDTEVKVVRQRRSLIGTGPKLLCHKEKIVIPHESDLIGRYSAQDAGVGASGLHSRYLSVLSYSCAARGRSFAHWKSQHLSTDNLSFVAGLRGRPVVPAPDLRQKKVRRQPKAATTKDDGDEVCTRRLTCTE